MGEIPLNGDVELRFGTAGLATSGLDVKYPGENCFCLEILEAPAANPGLWVLFFFFSQATLSAARGLTGRPGIQGVKRQAGGQILLGGYLLGLGSPGV